MNTPRDTGWYNNFYNIIKNQLPPPPGKKKTKYTIKNPKNKTKRNKQTKFNVYCDQV